MSELYTPLQKRQQEKPSGFPYGAILAGILCLPIFVGGAAIFVLPKSQAEAPYAIAPFPQEIVKAPVQSSNVTQPVVKTPTISIIDGMTGRSKEVPINGAFLNGNEPTPQKIPVTPNALETATNPIEMYSAAFKPTVKQATLPRVAVIMGGKELPTLFEKLPLATTIALPSLVGDAYALSEQLRGRGLELLLQLPPEDLGKEAKPLKAGALPTQNLEALNSHLKSFQSYIGIFLPASPKFVSNEQGFSAILRETSKRGLLFVEDGTSKDSLTVSLGKSLAAPALRVDVVLESGGTLAQRFLDLENIAKREGVAVGYLSANNAAMLISWAKGVESRGVLFTPLSAVLGRKGL